MTPAPYLFSETIIVLLTKYLLTDHWRRIYIHCILP
jgi:hypothetical protein